MERASKHRRLSPVMGWKLWEVGKREELAGAAHLIGRLTPSRGQSHIAGDEVMRAGNIMNGLKDWRRP